MWQKLSNRQIGIGLAGSVLLAVAVGSGLRIATSDSPEVVADSSLAPTEAVTPFQAGPFVPSSPQLRLADPALLRSTSKEARLQTVTAGRLDPFAPVVLGGSPRPKAAPAAAAAPVASAVLPGQPLPVVPVAATQALPPLPVAIAPLPSLGPVAGPVAAAPGLAPGLPSLGAAGAPSLSLVDRIEVSGVAQIGDRVSAIIKEPGASTSRYVRAGDAIAGGQVRVKRIDLSSGEPLVVLEYNGQEFYRSVGSTAVAGLL